MSKDKRTDFVKLPKFGIKASKKIFNRACHKHRLQHHRPRQNSLQEKNIARQDFIMLMTTTAHSGQMRRILRVFVIELVPIFGEGKELYN